ncbi:MAG TPA: hypothetical protein VIT38_07575 [Allosphingosinicella sp.]
MYFDMYGPFEIARDNGCVPSRQPAMWGKVRNVCSSFDYDEVELERAIGCYAFGLRYGDTFQPWYVGMTIAERGFRGEVFQPHKRRHYDAVIGERKGAPIMFLMPLLTPEGRFSRDRGTNKPLIEWVEKMLFGVALKRNPKCRNQRDTRFLRNVVVHGVFNSRPPGKPGPSVIAARKMFGAQDD